jgi:hypothetical protein
MSTDDLLFLFASDWFVAHAGAIGLLGGLDQDDVEAVSVAARTPVQALMAQAESYYAVSFEAARIAASADDFLARCRGEVRGYDRVAARVARCRALDAEDFNRMSALQAMTRVDGNDRFLPPAARAVRARLDAIVDAGTAGFTSWDESLDLFRRLDGDTDGDTDGSVLVDQLAAVFAPWRLLEAIVADGGFDARAWAALEDCAARLGIPEATARHLAAVADKVAAL